jgi:hypothetical protein
VRVDSRGFFCVDWKTSAVGHKDSQEDTIEELCTRRISTGKKVAIRYVETPEEADELKDTLDITL